MWVAGGEEYATNPALLVTPGSLGVVALWRWCQGDGGLAQLPDGGGINDQAAWLLDAFAVLSAAEAELRRQEKAGGG